MSHDLRTPLNGIIIMVNGCFDNIEDENNSINIIYPKLKKIKKIAEGLKL